VGKDFSVHGVFHHSITSLALFGDYSRAFGPYALEPVYKHLLFHEVVLEFFDIFVLNTP